MSKAHVTIEANSSAFYNDADEYDPAPEVARILRRLADKLDEDPQGWLRSAYDSNGNMVASLVIEQTEESA